MQRPIWKQRRVRRALKHSAGVTLALTLLLWAWIYGVSFPQQRLAPEPVTSTLVVDRHGKPLREVLNQEQGRGRWLDLGQVSDNLVLATLHAEDKRFYEHPGVDPVAMGRALWQNLSQGRVISGASTLTQQTVKLVMPPRPRRALGPKLMEAIWALRLERSLGKDQILEQYLNRAPYGNQLFGVEAAARVYFGQAAHSLSLGQASLLAVLPRSPSASNPYRDLDRALAHRRELLDRMLERGAISAQAHQRALEETVSLLPREGRPLAPHFTDYVLEQARQLHPEALPDTLRTTLELPLQQQVEGIVEQHLARLEGKNLSQAAVVVLDNRSGQVRAWVGSRGYFDQEHLGGNDGVLALRQPGSTLKPFVYGLHLERGGTPADLLHDLPTSFQTHDGAYLPQNYNRSFMGPLSLREALGNSRNVPAVEVAAQVGVPKLLERLRLAGLDTLQQDADHYGLALALGDGEVRLLDLANAYAALARLGSWRPARVLQGQPEGPARRIFDREVAFQLLDVLSDDQARARSFGRHSALWLPYKVAAKTGTSAHFRDSWAVGATPDYTVAVWAGNFDGSPADHISGARGAAPVMRQVFQALYPQATGPAAVPWYRPMAGLKQVRVCALSGQPATEHCPATRQEWVRDAQHGASGAQGQGGLLQPGPTACQFHRALRLDSRNGLLAGPGCDPAFVREEVFHVLPGRLAEWGAKEDLAAPPTQESPLCPGGLAQLERHGAQHSAHQGVQLQHPLAGDRFLVDPRSPQAARQVKLRAVPPDADAAQGVSLTWFINGEPLGEVQRPWVMTWEPAPGTWRVGVGRGRVEDEVQIQVHAP